MFDRGCAAGGAPALTPEQIYQQITNGPGPESLGNAEHVARKQVDLQSDINQRVKKLQSMMAEDWTGYAGEQARNAATPMVEAAAEASDKLRWANEMIGRQRDGFERVRSRVVPMPPNPGEPNILEQVFPGLTNYADQAHAYNEAAAINKAAYTEYADTSDLVQYGMPENYATLDPATSGTNINLVSHDIETSDVQYYSGGDGTPDGAPNSQGPPSDGGGLPGGGIPGGGVTGGGVTGGGPGDGLDGGIGGGIGGYAPPNTVPEPVAQVPGDDSPGWGDWSSPEDGNGWLRGWYPTEYDDGNTSISDAPELDTRLDGSGVSGSRGGMSSGFGGSGSGGGSYGSGRGVAGGYVPGGGGGYGSSGSRGGSLGYGRSTGVAPTTSTTSGSTVSSTSGSSTSAASRARMPGMMGAGGQGQGGEDEEHERPSYLEEPDPENVFLGDLPKAVPPVIGADPPRKNQ